MEFLIVVSLAVLSIIILVSYMFFLRTPQLTQGVIVKKIHEPEVQSMICMPARFAGMAKMLHVEPEKWIIVIRGTVRGKEKERKVRVSKSNYENLLVDDTCSIE